MIGCNLLKNKKMSKKGPKKGYKQTEEHKRKVRNSLKMFRNVKEQQICKQYVENKLSTLELAKINRCTPQTIRNIIKRNGYDLRTQKELMKDPKVLNKLSNLIKKAWKDSKLREKMTKTNNTPEIIQKVLKNCHGKKCHYNNEFFPSLSERNCYIYLIKVGYKVIHNFLGRFDFLLNNKIVLEYHPCSWWLEKRSFKQYYKDRRKLLNEYGYKNLKLVVIKNLKEIEDKLKIN